MKAKEMGRLAKDARMRQRRDAISHPLRLRVLGLLGEGDGWTAKELAERLGMNPNRLYYHLRILEEAGVIVVAESRAVGRMAERVYKPADVGRYIWDPEEPEQMARMLGAVLEVNKLGAEDALFEVARAVKARKKPPIVTWGTPSFETTRDEIVEFTKRVEALQMEFRKRAKKLLATAGTTRGKQPRRLRFAWLAFEESG